VPTIPVGPGMRALGWDDGWGAALADLGDPTVWPARVSRVDRGLCTVMTGTAEVRVAAQRGLEVAVGDWVAIRPGPGPSAEPGMVAVLPRRSVFRRASDTRGGAPRVVAANIDIVLLCDALDGSLSLRHLERFLALTWQGGATPVVLITKSDTSAPEVVAAAVEAVEAVAGGARVVVVSSTTGEGMSDLALYLTTGRTLALLGLSGAGKSTLVNLLAGADILATGAVRSDGSGRHTTTHRQLVVLPGGGLLIDTPGMRTLSVVGASQGVEQAFEDIEELARSCRYSTCSHTGEEGCALTAALLDGRLERDRLESWLRLKTGSASSEMETARTEIAERKQRKAGKVAQRRAARK
jgi:ribosome biogenesis GTPase / thiamine phosphate phosphatase